MNVVPFFFWGGGTIYIYIFDYVCISIYVGLEISQDILGVHSILGSFLQLSNC